MDEEVAPTALTDVSVQSAPARRFPRFCVAFIECEDLNTDAATYLILSQNLVQSIYEFEVLDFDNLSKVYEFKLEKYREGLTSPDYMSWIKRLITAFCEEIRISILGWGAQAVENCYWIVITETAMPEDFYGDISDNLTVFSISAWRREMAPPSVLEFILTLTQVGIVNYFAIGQSHVETRGCISDFNPALSTVRQTVLLGSICSTCKGIIDDKYGTDATEALRTLLPGSWIGSSEQVDSVAGILRKVFNYDLYRAKGLSADWRDTVTSELFKTVSQETIKGAFLVFVTWMLLHFGLKAK